MQRSLKGSSQWEQSGASQKNTYILRETLRKRLAKEGTCVLDACESGSLCTEGFCEFYGQQNLMSYFGDVMKGGLTPSQELYASREKHTASSWFWARMGREEFCEMERLGRAKADFVFQHT